MVQVGMPPPPQQKGGLFQNKKPVMPDISGITEDIGNVGRRVRMLEESFSNMRRALQVTEHNMLDKNKSFSTEIRTIMSDISDVKRDIYDVKEKMIQLLKEMEESAKREDLKVLEKYVNLWNPVKFVTQQEVEQIVKEYVEREMNKEKP